MFFSRVRQYLPMREDNIIDDREDFKENDNLYLNWPNGLKKPRIGLIQDKGPSPYWTRYAHFLENNSIPFEFYNIHDHDWLQKGREFDVIMGKPISAAYELDEFQNKFFILQKQLNKFCLPSFEEVFLYENKLIEAYLSEVYRFPFIQTYSSFDKADALLLAEHLRYPCVSKIVPGSGSVGVELIHTKDQAKKIINQVFSSQGRKIHILYERQKNFVYFQDYIPNDGYDIRVIVVGEKVFGFYRKAPKGDFRASGMKIEEKRDLPSEAMKIARKVNETLNSPLLVVDMLHGNDGNYYINEISPLCGISTQDELQVNGIPGVYIFSNDGTYHFEPVNYWIHEAVLYEFFNNYYLPKVQNIQ
jgi:glutathione synthase/RimK-type ligase-like ATP-grasp enzyme